MTDDFFDWPELPAEIQSICISKLDLKSRMEFRATSKKNKLMVDNTRCCMKFLILDFNANLPEDSLIAYDKDVVELTERNLDRCINTIKVHLHKGYIERFYFCSGYGERLSTKFIDQFVSIINDHQMENVFLDFIKPKENIQNNSEKIQQLDLLRAASNSIKTLTLCIVNVERFDLKDFFAISSVFNCPKICFELRNQQQMVIVVEEWLTSDFYIGKKLLMESESRNTEDKTFMNHFSENEIYRCVFNGITCYRITTEQIPFHILYFQVNDLFVMEVIDADDATSQPGSINSLNSVKEDEKTFYDAFKTYLKKYY